MAAGGRWRGGLPVPRPEGRRQTPSGRRPPSEPAGARGRRAPAGSGGGCRARCPAPRRTRPPVGGLGGQALRSSAAARRWCAAPFSPQAEQDGHIDGGRVVGRPAAHVDELTTSAAPSALRSARVDGGQRSHSSSPIMRRMNISAAASVPSCSAQPTASLPRCHLGPPGLPRHRRLVGADGPHHLRVALRPPPGRCRRPGCGRTRRRAALR